MCSIFRWDLKKKNIFFVPLLVQSPVSGPDHLGDGDSPPLCSWWWSGHTGNSWTLHFLLERHPYAAPRKQTREQKEKETLLVTQPQVTSRTSHALGAQTHTFISS